MNANHSIPLGRCLFVLVMVGSVFGCHTTGDMQQRAAALADEVGKYRAEQSQRIEQLNANYRTTFAEMMQRLRDLHTQQLRQGREIDSQMIADQLVSDWDAGTLREAFRTAFEQGNARQRDAIEQADQAVLAARTAYVEQYRKADLELKKLDGVENALRLLATPEDRYQTAANLALDMGKIYVKLRAKADAASGGNLTGGSGNSP